MPAREPVTTAPNAAHHRSTFVDGVDIFYREAGPKNAPAPAVISPDVGFRHLQVAVPGVAPWEEFVREPYLWHFALHSVADLPELAVRGADLPIGSVR